MEELNNRRNITNKQIMFSLIGIAILIVAVAGVTYSFFNYTRTGAANNIGTGRIYFNMTQNGALNMTNIFPLKSTETNNAVLDTVSVGIVGDTTYDDGEEFEITLVDVTNTINGKKIPINYIATYTAVTGKNIGEESDDYWNAKNSKNADIYTLTETGKVEEGKQVLVGYIKNSASGIEGTLTIKAYIDADRIAISDTYDSANPGTDNMGTTSTWVNGRTVFTTTEWNSFQTSGTPISFKMKAESNEGIWVEEPSKGIESCPDCKFMYYVADPSDITTVKLTTWNQGIWDDTNSQFVRQTPTQITSGLYDNYEELIATTGKNYFLGVKLNNNNEVTNAYACGVKDGTPFCIEGTSDESKYTANQTLLQGANLYNNTCTEKVEDEGTENEYRYSECGPRDNSGSVSARADTDGRVIAGVGDDHCVVDQNGNFECLESSAVEPGGGGIELDPPEPGGGGVVG